MKASLIGIAILLITACGGGGGSSSEPPADNSNIPVDPGQPADTTDPVNVPTPAPDPIATSAFEHNFGSATLLAYLFDGTAPVVVLGNPGDSLATFQAEFRDGVSGEILNSDLTGGIQVSTLPAVSGGCAIMFTSNGNAVGCLGRAPVFLEDDYETVLGIEGLDSAERGDFSLEDVASNGTAYGFDRIGRHFVAIRSTAGEYSFLEVRTSSDANLVVDRNITFGDLSPDGSTLTFGVQPLDSGSSGRIVVLRFDVNSGEFTDILFDAENSVIALTSGQDASGGVTTLLEAITVVGGRETIQINPDNSVTPLPGVTHNAPHGGGLGLPELPVTGLGVVTVERLTDGRNPILTPFSGGPALNLPTSTVFPICPAGGTMCFVAIAETLENGGEVISTGFAHGL